MGRDTIVLQRRSDGSYVTPDESYVVSQCGQQWRVEASSRARVFAEPGMPRSHFTTRDSLDAIRLVLYVVYDEHRHRNGHTRGGRWVRRGDIDRQSEVSP